MIEFAVSNDLIEIIRKYALIVPSYTESGEEFLSVDLTIITMAYICRHEELDIRWSSKYGRVEFYKPENSE